MDLCTSIVSGDLVRLDGVWVPGLSPRWQDVAPFAIRVLDN